MRLRALILLVLCFSCSRASAESEEGTPLLDLSKQRAEALPYFLRHMPAESISSGDQTVEFRPLPEGISAHLSEIGYLGGRSLFLVRYLSDARLIHGNAGAVGMVLLCSVNSEPKNYAPLIVDSDADGDTIDDFSVSPVQHLGDLAFVWVRRDYSGTADTIQRTALTAADPSMPPTRSPRPTETIRAWLWQASDFLPFSVRNRTSLRANSISMPPRSRNSCASSTTGAPSSCNSLIPRRRRVLKSICLHPPVGDSDY
jgi:hypothetical protein